MKGYGGISLNLHRAVPICILFCIMLFLSACKPLTPEERFIQGQKFIAELNCYSTTARYRVMKDDEIREYRFKQWVQLPDNFKIQMLWPENLRNKTILSDGKEIWIHHPLVNDTLRFDLPAVKEQRPLFIGDFINDYWLSEEVRKEIREVDGKEYIVLGCPSLHGSKRDATQWLWLNGDNFLPVKLVTCDQLQNVLEEVSFDNFDKGWKVPEDFFNIPSRV